MPNDEMLSGLLLDRQRLTRDYAKVLKRVGPNHPERKARNKSRSAKRKALRKALRANADAIAAHCMAMHPPT